MELLLSLLLLGSIIFIIIGLINPRLSLWWKDEEDRVRNSVLRFYGASLVISLILILIISNQSEANSVEKIVTIFKILIVGFAIISFFGTNKKLWKVNSEIKKLKREVSNSENNIVNINKIFNESSNVLKEDWKNYYNIVNSKANPNKILDTNYYLGVNKLVNKYSNRTLANAIPGLLTGIGILGTFLGLVKGLDGLDNIADVDLIKQQITVLISGMRVAFTSSLYAIGFSLLWTLLDKVLISHTKRKIEELNDELHRVLPIRIESNLLDEIVDNQREHINTTKEFVSDTLIPELVNGLQEAVEQSIAPSIQSMNSNIESFVDESAASREDMVNSIESAMNDNLVPHIAQMRNIMDDLAGFSMDKQAESIDKMVNKFLSTFNEAFDHQFEALRDTLEDVIEWQKETKKETEGLIEVVSQGAKQQNELLHSTEEALSNLSTYITEFEQVNQNLNKNVSKLNDVGSKLITLEEMTGDKLDKLINSQQEFEEMRRSHMVSMNKQVNKIESYWSSIENNFTKLNNNLTDGMNQFAENTHKGLERTFQSFDDNLAEIANRLGVTITELDEMLEEMPNTFTKLTGLLEEFIIDREEIMNNFTEQNKIFQSGFNDVVAKLEARDKESQNKIKEIIYKNLKDKLSKNDLANLEARLTKIENIVEGDIQDLSNKLGEDLSQIKEEILKEIDQKLKQDDKQSLFARFGG